MNRALAILFSLGAVLWATINYSSLCYESYLIPANGLAIGKDWFPVVNLISNGYFLWRIDPISVTLAQTIFGAWLGSVRAVVTLELIVVGLGLWILLGDRRTNTRLMLATLLPIALLSVFGGDIVVLGAVVWVPILAAISRSLFGGGSGRTKILLLGLLLGCSYLTWCSANQFFPVSLALALVLGSWLSSERPVGFVLGNSSSLPLFYVLTLSLSSILLSPDAPLPRYPNGARVVANSTAAGFILPLVGSSTTVDSLNRQAANTTFSQPSLILLCLSILVVFVLLGRKLRKPELLQPALAAFFLVACAALETLANDRLALILPGSVLQRLIPGLAYSSLVPLELGLGLIIIFCVLDSLNSVIFAGLVALPIICYGQVTWKSKSVQPFFGAIELPYPTDAHEPNSPDHFQQMLLSPSFNVVKTFGAWILQPEVKNLVKTVSFASLDTDDVQLRLSNRHTKIALRRLSDGKFDKRWKSSEGKLAGQNGQEKIWLYFREPKPLLGIDLPTGKYALDYPRGIRISFLAKCRSVDDMTRAQLSVAYEMSTWNGPLRFSSDGYPYFGPLGDVKIFFPKKTIAQCVQIEQTGTSSEHDWSITEIRLAEVK